MIVWQPLNLTAACPSSTVVGACSNFGFVYLNLLVQLYGGSADKRKQDMCDEETKPESIDGMHYDFIVVGAGAAGCVVANRLTENPNWKVLLLEAGPEEPDITRVPGLSTVLQGSNIDWQYTTEPNGKSCLSYPGGRCTWPRGKTMGGSTSINSLGYVRGNSKDYDRWALLGNKGWSYKDVLPFFKKTERNLNKYAVDSDYHGVKGEQHVAWFPHVDDPANMVVEAYTEKGIPFCDHNGASQECTMQLQAFQVDGERVSANVAMIQHIRHTRKNLKIKTDSVVTKILIDEFKNAYGVTYIHNNKQYNAFSTKEVIISGGTINSAKLLMLSGIGPKKHLESLNIPVVKDLAVGENLQDHVTFNGMIVALSNKTSTARSNEEILCAIKEFYEMKIKKGPLAGNGPVMSSAFTKSKPHLCLPDLQFQGNHCPDWKEFIVEPLTVESTANRIMPSSFYNAYIPRAMNIRPISRGIIRLNKTNPQGPPLIHANYLGDDRDLDVLMKGVEVLLSLEDTEAFKSRGAYFVREKMPHCKQHEWGTDEYFRCLIKQYTTTSHHQAGSCKMGPKWDKKAVLDTYLRVYGVKWLRVIDVSMMPILIGGNTCAPAMMIGERGVDFVIKYWQNRTNNYCF